jgi:hypothetical protein
VDLQGSYIEERPGMLARTNHCAHIAAPNSQELLGHQISYGNGPTIFELFHPENNTICFILLAGGPYFNVKV